MKVNELRIGNWVQYDGIPCQIESLTKVDVVVRRAGIFDFDNRSLEKAHPIELTEDVLLKIGFEDRKGYFNYSQVFSDENNYCDSIHIYYCPRLKHFKFTHDKVKECDLQTMDLYNIKYLHELQNAYYLLTSEEMEVKL